MSSVENLEEQVRSLAELVKQLQADNQRLCDTQATEEPAPSSRPDGVAARPTPLERLVCVPRERKCPRFSGKMAVDNISVEDWIEEARRSLTARPMPLLEQALYLYDLLDGEAKREIKFSPDRNNPELIFDVLKKMFRCSKSRNTLYRQFYHRRQLESESVREYSHALMELMEQIKDRDDDLESADRILRDQFVEGLRDDKLQGDLLDKISANPRFTFRDIRSEAMDWLSRRTQPSRARAHSCNSHGANTSAVTVGPSSELVELKECFRKQQAQLDAILSQLGQSRDSSSSTHQPSAPRPRSYRYQADGKPICMRCNRAGHIARVCRAAFPEEPGPVSQSDVRSGRQAMVAASSVLPQEN